MVKFFHVESSLSQDKIEEIEQSLDLRFPHSYKQHLMLFNGGKCTPNKFKFLEKGNPSDSYIDWFLSIYDGEYDNFVEYFNDYKIEEKRMPKSIFPIAHDPGGNLICLDSVDGKVYFWDHESEIDYSIEDDSNFSNLHLIANSFSEFIDNLY